MGASEAFDRLRATCAEEGQMEGRMSEEEMSQISTAVARRKRHTGKGLIVIVDDKPEEREKARVCVEAAGYGVYATDYPCRHKIEASNAEWANFRFYIGICDGVITDLVNSHDEPAGLLVALEGVCQNAATVICTNAAEQGGHHAKAISWIYDGYFARCRDSRVGWEEEKDWARALGLLEERLSEV